MKKYITYEQEKNKKGDKKDKKNKKNKKDKKDRKEKKKKKDKKDKERKKSIVDEAKAEFEKILFFIVFRKLGKIFQKF